MVSNRTNLKKVAAELAKCICVCQNCHAKVHAGLLQVPRDLLVEMHVS